MASRRSTLDLYLGSDLRRELRSLARMCVSHMLAKHGCSLRRMLSSGHQREKQRTAERKRDRQTEGEKNERRTERERGREPRVTRARARDRMIGIFSPNN